MRKIKRAIISVTDKTGIEEFAAALSEAGVEIISTGGTAERIKGAGVEVVSISSYTGFPEMLDGRVKTLHPKIHGGILGVREDPHHMQQMKENGIEPIDMVVVNLYAFEETVAGGCSLAEAMEKIDIGGPTMIRAAAKNYTDVAVVVDPDDYAAVIEEMKTSNGMLSHSTRFALAKKVFALTARYDAAVSNHLGSVPKMPSIEPPLAFPETLTVQFKKMQDLRYGENPHQSAAFYHTRPGGGEKTCGATQLHGKALSFNNLLDLSAAHALAIEMKEPAAVIVKHNNPCGVAASEVDLLDAYNRAYACDKKSAFGGIVGLNRPVTKDLAETMSRIFIEAVVAPAYDADALDILKKKKNLRVMKNDEVAGNGADRRMSDTLDFDIKRVSCGVLIQSLDTAHATDLKTVTERVPSRKELEDLLFSWKVCKHVKSNAIILVKDSATIGIGAGQMSRIDSTRIAVMKAEDAGLDARGSVLASDAFFPFRDNVDMAASKGIVAIIQPGGSIRDEEVIDAANEHNIAMIFTGIRHFRH